MVGLTLTFIVFLHRTSEQKWSQHPLCFPRSPYCAACKTFCLENLNVSPTYFWNWYSKFSEGYTSRQRNQYSKAGNKERLMRNRHLIWDSKKSRQTKKKPLYFFLKRALRYEHELYPFRKVLRGLKPRSSLLSLRYSTLKLMRSTYGKSKWTLSLSKYYQLQGHFSFFYFTAGLRMTISSFFKFVLQRRCWVWALHFWWSVACFCWSALWQP